MEEFNVRVSCENGARLTALWCRRKEANLEFFFTKLIGEPNNSIPGTFTNRLAVHVEIVDEMNLPSSIHRDLVAGTDGQAWVIARAIIQDSFARSGVRLLVNCTLHRKLLLNTTRRKKFLSLPKDGGIDIESRGLSARGRKRASGRSDTMLDSGASGRVRVIRFDIEHDGDDIELQPQASTEIRGLGGFRKGIVGGVRKEPTSRRRLRVTPAPRNLHRCSEENLRREEMIWDSIISVCLSDSAAS